MEQFLPFIALLAVIFLYHHLTGARNTSMQGAAVVTLNAAHVLQQEGRLACWNATTRKPAVRESAVSQKRARLFNSSTRLHSCVPGLFLCAWLGCSVYKANDVIRKIVARSSCEPSELAAALVFVSTNITITSCLTSGQQWRSLLLLPPRAALSVWHVAFNAAVTDSLVRCLGIIPKLLIAAVTLGCSGSSSSSQHTSSRSSGGGVPVCSRVNGAADHTVRGRHSSGGGGSMGASSGGGVGSSSSSGGSSSGTTGNDGHTSGTQWAACGVSQVGVNSSIGEDLDSNGASTGMQQQAGRPSNSTGGGSSRSRDSSSGGRSTFGSDGGSSGAHRSSSGGRVEDADAGILHTLQQQAAQAEPVVAPHTHVNARRCSRLLALYDYIQAAYRAVLPIPAWHAYLLQSTPNGLLCRLLAISYLCVKAHGLFRRGQLLMLATRIVMRTGAAYGRYLRKGEVGMGADAPCCPICQDPCTLPIRLDCTHVFCEECLAEWLEREPTCPMCRCCVKPRGLSFGDGATSLLPQLF